MSNTLPQSQQLTESSHVSRGAQRPVLEGNLSQGPSKLQSPTAQAASAHNPANQLQQSSKSPKVLFSNAVVSPTSILKEGRQLFRGPDAVGQAFHGVAGQDIKGGYHGGGSPFGHQEQFRNRLAAGNQAQQHVNFQEDAQPPQRDPSSQIQKTYAPPSHIHSNREHHITTFFQPDETYKHPNQTSVFRQNALRQEFKSLQQIEEEVQRGGQPLSQNEMLKPSRGPNQQYPHLDKINQMIRDQKAAMPSQVAASTRNQMDGVRAAGYSGPQIAFTQEQLYGQPSHAGLAKVSSPRFHSILQNAKQMQLAGRESEAQEKRQRTQSMGGSPTRQDKEAEPSKLKNVFTTIAIPNHQISSRAHKLLSGEYAQSFNTLDPRPEVPRRQETVEGYTTRKNEPSKYFGDLEEGRFKNTSTMAPTAQGHSPIKPAPIFRQATIWKNLQDKAVLVQRIEESSLMRNKHYQKSTQMRSKENESVFMSDAQKQSQKEVSWNDHSTSIGHGNTHTARQMNKSKLLPTDRSHMLDGGPTINTLRSNNETGLDASQMKKDRLMDVSVLQEQSSKEYQAADKFQSPDRTAQNTSFIGQQSAEDKSSFLMRKGTMEKSILLNRHMNPDSARGSATFGHEQASPRDNSQTPMNASQELEALHMYDSLLLGNTISQTQLKEQIDRKRKMNFSISHLRQGPELEMAQGSRKEFTLKVQNFQDRRNVDVKLKQGLEKQLQRPQKYLQPIKGGSQHLERRHQSMYNTLDAPINKDAANVTDSSVRSNVNKVDLGELELETLKGTNIRQLSPITRQLNKLTGNTLNQLDSQLHALTIREQLKDNLLMKMKYKGKNVEDSKQLMEKNTKLVKILKNQINTIVAPDDQKYQVILPNCNFETVEVLPQTIPTFLKIPCSLLRSPCQFEVLMNDLDAMHVMLSTEHRFPQEDKGQFEKEKLVLKDLSVLTKIKQRSQTQDGQQKKKKMSILLIEASSKSKKGDDEIRQAKVQGGEAPAPIKRAFRFAKANFKETFDEGDFLYVTLLSQNGGTIRLKVNFSNSQGGFGAETLNANDEMNAARRKKELSNDVRTPAQIEDELHAWFKQNMHLLDSCKHLFQEGALDFVALNKGPRLEMCSYKNLAIEHQRKMWINQLKLDAAKQKAEQNTLYNYYKNKKNITKWEDYRETKIELTAILIRVLKRKNFTRKWLRIHKAGQTYAKFRTNLYIRRHLNHILFTSLRCAMRFKIDYKYRYQKQYGFSMAKRKQNVIRRALNFGGTCKYYSIEEGVRKSLHGFIFNAFLCFSLSDRFTLYNDNLIYVQAQRRHIQMTREYRFLRVYKRMEIIRDILIPIYNKKKTKKHAKRIAANLKKVMNKERVDDYKKVKEQFSLWGTKNMMDNQNLLDSIRIRTLTITHQILATATQKNEAGEKIHKAEIENIKVDIEAQLRKVRIRTKKMDVLDRDLIGISEKEIKELAKLAGGRKPDPKVVKDAAYHKYDTNKIFKDDKLLKNVKTGFVKALTKPKNAPAKGAKGKKGKATEDGQPEDAEGADGMEGADMEGMDGENADGEGMDGENAEGEGMDGEAPEGDGDAGDGEGAGEGEADGDAAGDDAEGDGADGQEGSAQITQNASAEDLGMDGEADEADDGDDDAKSPKKKKAASRSLSKGKKKKKSDEDTITVIKQKESTKVKQKWILAEEVETPQEILDWIKENYPAEQPPPDEEPPKDKDGKEKKRKILSGVDLMTAEAVKAIVHEKYYVVQKKKLIRITEESKLKPNLTQLTRMLLHLSLNIGPQAKVNEDIEEQLQDGVQNLVLQAQTSLSSTVLKDPKQGEKKDDQDMSKTQEIKQPPADAAARSHKSGGSLHPSQCSKKSRKQQHELDQKSQQSKQSWNGAEGKELDNVFVTEPEPVQQADQEDAADEENEPEAVEEDEDEEEEDEEQE